MGATSKQRTPSRCREWERERRNKFNLAVTKLGDLIRTAIKEGEDDSKDADTTQYPKIEIIQRAITFIDNYLQEKSKLKAEILALQVKLQANIIEQQEKKDVSTQISRGIKNKLESSKYNKLLLMKKSKQNTFKDTTSVTKNDSKPTTTDVSTITKSPATDAEKLPNQNQSTTADKLPKLLPKPNSFSTDLKGADNTIVVMPATPFILPQRPLLFPTTPPTFVLFNHNMPTVNNTCISINGKKSNDNITKTTMVNILPISAYSRPLSASKSRKSIKLKNNNVNKKIKPAKKQDETKKALKQTKKGDVTDKNNAEGKELTDKLDQIIPKSTECSDKNIPAVQKASNTVAEMINSETITKVGKETMISKGLPDASKGIPSSLENTIISKEIPIPIADDKVNKTGNKDSQHPEKVKLPNILETTLCESAVDGGNARLELAEELLAASPTAAFLMSFPLVSGNRADSPAEDPPNVSIATTKDNHRRTDIITQTVPYYEKTVLSEPKEKPNSNNNNKSYANEQIKQSSHKFVESATKLAGVKSSNAIAATSTDNPFLNLPMPSVISTCATMTDSTFAFDLDCNTSKSLPSQPTSYGNNNNLFYKSDPYNAMKNTIYSTSSISSGHDFNSLGLYPCAMEKYSSKNKSDYHNVDDNLMKIGSSRLTYDIDLGWSQKGFDFVNSSTNSTTFNKDNLLTTASTPYTTSSYNPFTPDFHVPLVNSNKKDSTSKPISSFADTIANFYSQTTSLWTDDAPFYNNNISSSKSTTANYLPLDNAQTIPITKQSSHKQYETKNYLPLDNAQSIPITKQSSHKQYEAKHVAENYTQNTMKLPNFGMGHQIPEKYTKKSPSKMHINWMTSETRPMQNTYVHNEVKETAKSSYVQADHVTKKQEHTDSNYFPISIHNYPSHTTQEEFQVWPSARPLGTTEISIDPPPINLPTLVGDLALGPHEKKKHAESSRAPAHTDIQNCNNFLSVTQLMNRSTDNMSTRCEGPMLQTAKSAPSKQNIPQYSDHRKSTRLDNIAEPCYNFNETKLLHPYDPTNQYPNTKIKSTKPADKSVKNQKHSYTAEALIRGGSCTQKNPENKFAMAGQKYNDCHTLQDSSVAQVSHFPPILDYTENSYTSQQFSGTTLYNTTTNTISNSFYSNFMPGSTNLMSSNYAGAPFSGEFLDYNQSAECNYQNQRYEEFKMKVNAPTFHHEKGNNLKSSRRDFSAKHKLDCSKKDSKKYQSKRAKLSNEEDWSEGASLLWQNKTHTKRHMSEELSFPNYMGNQGPAQYQPDIFNSHLMPNAQAAAHNVDRSLASFPATSRANFNLSTIFPEITMKVQ